ncbi:glycoside hydrolase family 127 protein [Pseudoxanthomonas gei]|uniref:glycoside hydrolase family 127 protein n=1 Tax=Pseudoxanthomonas gei TaxID=1383030 RepID=UPI001B86466A|nr:beta-L-arabinofuranosidase domain-containing protein [Pseudoxanthomonas gei]
MIPLLPSVKVELGGLLGAALAANQSGRLSTFIVDENSPAIGIFDPARAAKNDEGDWYGEHAGKWLVATAKSAARTGDPQLIANLLRVTDYLVAVQDTDGYLGTYAADHRFMRRQPPKPGTWDGAPSVRTWDIWTHSYLVLGLLEVHRHFPKAAYLEAARRIGDLCWHTLGEGGIDICELGNHHGMSATVLMDAAVDLYFATGEPRYLALSQRVLQQADANPDLALLRRALEGVDASEIATGKAYQLAWNLVGLAKLHKATGDASYRQAVENLWQSIRDHHLSLGGGPWGGVGHRSREVFNPAGVFSPQAYVETCSVLAWIQLNRELLAISGEARYAEEIERTAYNDLLGAMAPNGEDWCYYSFPNGRRVHTTYWRCCKSSGAMAIEELPAIAYTQSAQGHIAVNLLGPGSAAFDHPAAGSLKLTQATRFPFDGAITLAVQAERRARFVLSVRVPQWAQGATLAINGVAHHGAVTAGQYAVIEREWSHGDQVTLDLPMVPVAHVQVQQNTQESRAPDGSPVRQQVMHYEYVAVTRGPLVYASGLVDGYKTGETLRLSAGPSTEWLQVAPQDQGEGPAIHLHSLGRTPLTLEPYYRTGGRVDGAWRLTWMSLAPVEARDAVG